MRAMIRGLAVAAALSAGLVSAGLVSAAGPAAAQTAEDDWDYGEDPARDLALAAVTFDSFGLAVRCVDESLSVVFSGLPPATTRERTLNLRVDDGPDMTTSWVSAADGTSAFAVWPRALAEMLSEGGRLSIGARDGDRVRRYVYDIPSSPAAVGKVFSACGRTLSAQDAEAPTQEDFAGLRWAREPRITFPDRARYEGGLAAVQCSVRANGAVRDCKIESEFPEGSRFGRAATLGAHQTARVEPVIEGDDMEGRRIAFVARYWTRDDPGPVIPSRLPKSEDEERLDRQERP